MNIPEKFWEMICAFDRIIWNFLILTLTLVVLTAFTFPFLTAGTDVYLISVANIVILTMFLATFGYLSIRCKKRMN